MTTKLVTWASNDGQITKSKLSDGRRAKFLPSATGFDYDLSVIWEMSVKLCAVGANLPEVDRRVNGESQCMGSCFNRLLRAWF
jgi:hypothetical protein